MTISREEAMAAIREAEIWTGDGGTIEMGSREAADTLLTLARAGAEWMFASEETEDRMAEALVGHYCTTGHDRLLAVRAALAALSQKE